MFNTGNTTTSGWDITGIVFGILLFIIVLIPPVTTWFKRLYYRVHYITLETDRRLSFSLLDALLITVPSALFAIHDVTQSHTNTKAFKRFCIRYLPLAGYTLCPTILAYLRPVAAMPFDIWDIFILISFCVPLIVNDVLTSPFLITEVFDSSNLWTDFNSLYLITATLSIFLYSVLRPLPDTGLGKEMRLPRGWDLFLVLCGIGLMALAIPFLMVTNTLDRYKGESLPPQWILLNLLLMIVFIATPLELVFRGVIQNLIHARIEVFWDTRRYLRDDDTNNKLKHYFKTNNNLIPQYESSRVRETMYQREQLLELSLNLGATAAQQSSTTGTNGLSILNNNNNNNQVNTATTSSMHVDPSTIVVSSGFGSINTPLMDPTILDNQNLVDYQSFATIPGSNDNNKSSNNNTILSALRRDKKNIPQPEAKQSLLSQPTGAVDSDGVYNDYKPPELRYQLDTSIQPLPSPINPNQQQYQQNVLIDGGINDNVSHSTTRSTAFSIKHNFRVYNVATPRRPPTPEFDEAMLLHLAIHGEEQEDEEQIEENNNNSDNDQKDGNNNKSNYLMTSNSDDQTLTTGNNNNSIIPNNNNSNNNNQKTKKIITPYEQQQKQKQRYERDMANYNAARDSRNYVTSYNGDIIDSTLSALGVGHLSKVDAEVSKISYQQINFKLKPLPNGNSNLDDEYDNENNNDNDCEQNNNCSLYTNTNDSYNNDNNNNNQSNNIPHYSLNIKETSNISNYNNNNNNNNIGNHEQENQQNQYLDEFTKNRKKQYLMKKFEESPVWPSWHERHVGFYRRGKLYWLLFPSFSDYICLFIASFLYASTLLYHVMSYLNSDTARPLNQVPAGNWIVLWIVLFWQGCVSGWVWRLSSQVFPSVIISAIFLTIGCYWFGISA